MSSYRCVEHDPRVEWYRMQAERHGIAASHYRRDGHADLAGEAAREAGHFARLVLGLESLVGKHLVVMDVRVSQELSVGLPYRETE